MSDIEKLQKQYKDAIAVKDMLKSDGWKVLDEHLDFLYASNVSKLIETENIEARGILKGITLLRRSLELILSDGKKANEQLNKGTQ